MISENEIILYQPDEAVKIEVRVEDETVWLTQQQMADLFETTRNNITLHIGNIFKEHELDSDSVCKESLLTAADGKRYRTKFYNLDVIISVGYRVRSLRGTQFRQWATKVLKDHLLRGYSINQRIERLEHRVAETENKIDFFVRTSLPPVEGIFYDGQIFDAYKFVSDLIRSAKRRIVLIDNYVDDTVLQMLDKCQDNVSACIYTKVITANFRLDIERHNQQYRPISVHEFHNSHDRFLLIDNDVYHIGASLKDLGKRWFAFCKMQLPADEILQRLERG
ncbi:MAG: virulence RhuM family protein [Bacteroidales bacterium]|nr:virulence RhuM family protein [Bacteroidales bacterium]